MSDYTKTTNFSAKDALPSGDSNKIVKGTEHDTEYDAIATAIATKVDEPSGTVGNMVKIASGGQISDTGYAADAIPLTSLDIDGATQETTLSDTDKIPVYSANASANRYVDRDDFIGEIGAWVPLRQKTPSAASSADFDDGDIDSTYDTYIFVFENVEMSTGGIELRISTDGGSTYKSGATDYGYAYLGFGSADDLTANSVPLSGGGDAVSGMVRMYGPATGERTTFTWDLVGGGSGHVWRIGSARYNTATVVDAVRIFGSGTITGTITLYGITPAPKI